MIKLGFSLDISLSKFVLGVAGISAAVCAFQYFSSNKKQQRDFLKVEDKCSAEKESKTIPHKNKNVNPVGQNFDANSVSLKSTNNSVKYQTEGSKERFDEVLKTKPSCTIEIVTSKVRRPNDMSYSSNKKADVSTNLLSTGKFNSNTEVIDKSDKIVETNMNSVVSPKTSHSSSESPTNKHKQEIRHVDSSTQINENVSENESLVKCNEVITIKHLLEKDEKYLDASLKYVVDEKKSLESDLEGIKTSNKPNKRNACSMRQILFKNDAVYL